MKIAVGRATQQISRAEDRLSLASTVYLVITGSVLLAAVAIGAFYLANVVSSI